MIEFVVLAALCVISMLLVLFLRPSPEIVPQEERLIIYRLGHFERIACPGMVWLFRSIDKIQRRFSIRNDSKDCFVDGLFVYGIPMGLTLNMWYRYDPVTAATGDRIRLTDLAQFTESERRTHLAVKLRDSLVRQIGAIEQSGPLGSTATIVEKLMPVLPGVPACVEVLRRVQQELAQSLPSLGIFIDESQPIVITRLHPPEDIIKGFSRDRAAALLRMQFPDLPDSMMVHMLESIEGLQPLRVHEIRQVGNGTSAGVGAETRWTDDDGTMFRVPLAGGLPPNDKAPNHIETAIEHPALDSTLLSQNDLALLKRVPREPHEQKRAA